MIVTILFVGSIPNFGINIIEPRQDVLKVIYFAKDVHQACHKMAPMLVSCSGEDAHRSGSISSGYTVFRVKFGLCVAKPLLRPESGF